MNEVTLYNGDYTEYIKNVKNDSIDMILTDPPYGQTPLEWDKAIDFNILWQEIFRVAKKNAPILIFAQEPFASHLRLSNEKYYRYDWYWKKERLTNIFQVKRRPAKYVENICVFYIEQCNYCPIKVPYFGKPQFNKPKGSMGKTVAGNRIKVSPYLDDGTRYPCEILEFNRDAPIHHVHPTQKPVQLLEYLIKTYTIENDTVLDMFMGSGSTGVACCNTGRNFIGIELNQEYFSLSKERLSKAQSQQKLL